MKLASGSGDTRDPATGPGHTRRVLVVNPKGGCGKTTVATNLAGYYAASGHPAALLDYDPQGSSLHWLRLRGTDRPSIYGIDASSRSRTGLTRTWQLRIPAECRLAVLDAPAGVTRQQLQELSRGIDTILVPVLPSPIDIHATARFIEELLLATAGGPALRIGVVANRARERTIAYDELRTFLDGQAIDFVTTLRDTQEYVRAAALGLAIHEAGGPRAKLERQPWWRLARWLETPAYNHYRTLRRQTG